MTTTFIAFIGRHVGSAKRKRPAVRFLTRLLWCEAPSTARLGTLPRANDSTPCHFAWLDVQDGSVATDQQLPAFGRQWESKGKRYVKSTYGYQGAWTWCWKAFARHSSKTSARASTTDSGSWKQCWEETPEGDWLNLPTPLNGLDHHH